MADNFDSEIANTIRSLFELSTRMDERLKMLAGTSEKHEDKIEECIEQYNAVLNMMQALELHKQTSLLEGTKTSKSLDELTLKVKNLELNAARHKSILDKVFTYSMQILVALAAAFLIWKFGLQNNVPTP